MKLSNEVTMACVYRMESTLSLGIDIMYNILISACLSSCIIHGGCLSLSLQTFVVRNSQKARYALTLRMPVDDPAVNHFLIQTNQQSKPLAIIVQQGKAPSNYH